MSEAAVLDRERIDPAADAHFSPPGGAVHSCEPDAAIAEGCPNCGSLESWGKASWCPKCGFYPRLGISIGPALEVVGEVHTEPESALDVWRRLPSWARVLAGGVLLIFAASVAVRLTNPRVTTFRNTWAALQLAIGGLVFCTLHAVAMFRATTRHTNFGLVDAALHPIETWKATFKELPALAPRVWFAVWGLTGVACAVAILGGVRYSVLVEDWGYRQPAEATVRSRVRATALEKAVGVHALSQDFEQGATEQAQQELRAAEQAAREGIDLEAKSADCVVIGYRTDPKDGRVSELLLATVVDGQLQYVGSVSEGIPDSVREELSARLKTIARDRPFVNCSGAGTWVKPVIACKTNFKSWTEGKTFDGAKFTSLLADLDGEN